MKPPVDTLVGGHTPVPWLASVNDVPYAEHGGSAWTVDGADGSVCTIDSPLQSAEANARFIVKAVNNHEALVEAMKAAHGELLYGGRYVAAQILNVALSKLEEV